MIEADPATYADAPIGRWTAVGTSVVWCYSPTLCGSTCWGVPTVDDVNAVMRVFDTGAPFIAPKFDVVLDGRAIVTDGLARMALAGTYGHEYYPRSMPTAVEWMRNNGGAPDTKFRLS